MEKLDIEKIKPEIQSLAKKYRLLLLVLFGSQAKGKTHPQSDVDLAFISEKLKRPMEIAEMETEFSQALKIKELEMTDIKSATPFLLKQIAQNSILLYEKEPTLFSRFKIYAFKIFMEAQPLLKIREAQLNKFLR